MSEVWQTKYGPRRVRHDPPTLKEAIYAAQGLTSELQEQAEIAAALMGMPIEEVRIEVLKMAPPRNSAKIVTAGAREGTARTVIVERRPSRLNGAKMARINASGKPDPARGQAQERPQHMSPALPRRGSLEIKPSR